MIVANTVKGLRLSLDGEQGGWHHHLPTQEEYLQIVADLEAHKEACHVE